VEATGHSQQAETPVSGTLVFGSAGDLRARAGDKPIDLVPAGRLNGTTTALPPSQIRRLRLGLGVDETTRQPFLVFSQGIEELLQPRPTAPWPNLIVEDLPPSDLVLPFNPPGQCPECLPAPLGQPGTIRPVIVAPRRGAGPLLGTGTPGFTMASAVSDATLVERCDAAARRGRVRAQGEPQCFPGMGGDPTTCSSLLAAHGVFNEFIRACTTPAAAMSDPNLTQFAVLKKGGADERPFCSALLVTPTLALTAAHCFRDTPVSETRLYAWGAPDAAIRVALDPVSHGGVAAGLDEAVAVLRLDTPAEAAHEAVCFSDPAPPDALRLYGHMAPLLSPDAPWQERVQTGAFACSAFDTPAAPLTTALQRGCYRHSCQALGGFSGAPMFGGAPPDGCRTLVVGMHVGAAGPGGAVCAGQSSNSAIAGHLLRQVVDTISPTAANPADSR